jgi:predicted PurR-regulated permease PerM
VAQTRIFMALLAAVTLALAWVLWPLFGAVFWAVAFVIVLNPMAQDLTRGLGQRPTLAALAMVLGFVLLIILPGLLIVKAVLTEATTLIAAVRSGEIDLPHMFQTMLNVLPTWLEAALRQLDLGDLSAVQASASASAGDWIGANGLVLLAFGQNTAGAFVSVGVMLYLMFFLFRDGEAILARLKAAVPMERAILDDLLRTFTLVVRATVRGDILVALLQGGLGGLGFWALGIHAVLLWTVLMAVLSLFPVFGAALVWVPVAGYLLGSGMIWQGILLAAYGVLVISLIDNIARPWLVGQATRMPDYVVLISTIGGIATFGVQGFITGPVVAAMFMAVWTTWIALPRSSLAP